MTALAIFVRGEAYTINGTVSFSLKVSSSVFVTLTSNCLWFGWSDGSYQCPFPSVCQCISKSNLLR